MPTIINPTVTPNSVEWDALRNGLKECIKVAAPSARVYKSWPLRFSIGETVKLLTSKDDNDKVHAWIIGISEAYPTNPKSGGAFIQWDLTLKIWGFLGYDSVYSADTQTTIENEVKAITRILVANAKHFGMNNTQGLETDGLVKWEDIDVHAFGDESDVHVAQGKLNITLKEFLSGY